MNIGIIEADGVLVIIVIKYLFTIDWIIKRGTSCGLLSHREPCHVKLKKKKMGNLCGKPKDFTTKKTQKPPDEATSNVKKLIVPKWESDEPMSVEQLRQEREQFWDTQPHYGGNRGARLLLL